MKLGAALESPSKYSCSQLQAESGLCVEVDIHLAPGLPPPHSLRSWLHGPRASGLLCGKYYI